MSMIYGLPTGVNAKMPYQPAIDEILYVEGKHTPYHHLHAQECGGCDRPNEEFHQREVCPHPSRLHRCAG